MPASEKRLPLELPLGRDLHGESELVESLGDDNESNPDEVALALSASGCRALRALLDDFERGGECPLRQSHVDRVLERKALSNEDVLLVLGALIQRGVEVINDLDPVGRDEDDVALRSSLRSASDGFSRFMQLVKKEGLLTAAEEVALGRAMSLARRYGPDRPSSSDPVVRRGDEARERLIAQNIRLVLSIARRYVGSSDMDVEDLVQEGVFGLMRAVEKFDHTLGYKLSTYATWWIMQSITRAMSDRGYTIRLPVHLTESLWRVRRARRMLARHLLVASPTPRQIADELDLDVARVHFLLGLEHLFPVSLDAPDGESETIPLDFIESPWPSPEDDALASERAAKTLAAIETLDERAQDILKRRFGFEDGDEWTLERLGQRHGLTRERIRQIEEKALRKLQSHSRKLRLDEFREERPKKRVKKTQAKHDN